MNQLIGVFTQQSEQAKQAFALQTKLKHVKEQIKEVEKKVAHHQERLDFIQNREVFLKVSDLYFTNRQQLRYLKEDKKGLEKELDKYSDVPSTIAQAVYPTLRATKVLQLILDQPGMFCVGRLVCKEWNEYLISKVRPNLVLPKIFKINWDDRWDKTNKILEKNKTKYQLTDKSQEFYDFIIECILAHGCGHNITLTDIYLNVYNILPYHTQFGKRWHMVDHIIPDLLKRDACIHLMKQERYLSRLEMWPEFKKEKSPKETEVT